jgi:hypothetical protein
MKFISQCLASDFVTEKDTNISWHFYTTNVFATVHSVCACTCVFDVDAARCPKLKNENSIKRQRGTPLSEIL